MRTLHEDDVYANEDSDELEYVDQQTDAVEQPELAHGGGVVREGGAEGDIRL